MHMARLSGRSRWKAQGSAYKDTVRHISCPTFFACVHSKTDETERPLGIAALEDKIVQQAVGEILAAIYETEFYGFSYGFRPGRGCHDALDAMYVAIIRKKVSYVLDKVCWR